MEKVEKKDEYRWGLDLFRIMCCLGVLVYHIADDNLENGLTRQLYFSASFCIPGFFLLSGYFIGVKKELTKEYCEKKIEQNIKKLTGYIVFWIVIYFVWYGLYFNIVDEIEKAAISDGILPVGWFLFTWFILLIFSYPLHYLLKNYFKTFLFITIFVTFLLNLEIRNELNGIYFIERKVQALWMHIYTPYFMIGMCIGKIGKKFENRKILFWGGTVSIFAYCYYMYRIDSMENYDIPGSYYGIWYYSLWLISLFIFFLNFRTKNNYLKAYSHCIANNTFSVYMMHLPMLIAYTRNHPITEFKQVITYTFGLFIVINILTEIFRKLPVFRKLP